MSEDKNLDYFFSNMGDLVKKIFAPKKNNFVDKLSAGNLRGEFEFTMTDAAGNIIEHYIDKNLVVNAGRTTVMKLLGEAPAVKQLTQLAVGTNGTTPTGADTAITGAYTKDLGAVTYPTISSVRFAWTLGASEANGIAIREFGILSDDGTLFARKVREVINKNSDIILNGTWTISF